MSGMPAREVYKIMYAVIDTEATGLSLANDRVIELAIIGLDADGNKEWEWCSLINPERDTGHGFARMVHQIYPRDVEKAPTFVDFAGHVMQILSGRAIIAHNARFDLGMLAAEFRRLRQEVPDFVQICTADIARESGFRPYRLEACCEALGIEIDGAHHALADARATVSLAQHLVNFSDPAIRSDVVSHLRALRPWPNMPVVADVPVARPIPPSRRRTTCTRADAARARQEAVHRVAGDKAIPVVQTFSIDREKPESKYLTAVEWVLEDRDISTQQQQALDELRSELNLGEAQAHEVHMMFIRGLAGSMWADGSISSHEQFDLDLVGRALQLSAKDVEYARDNPIGLELTNDDCILKPGATVVFTGEMSISRSEWIARARTAGLRITGSVSGKTDWLVVPYGETGSTKSCKARGLGVRVVSEQRFRRMIDRLERSVTDPA